MRKRIGEWAGFVSEKERKKRRGVYDDDGDGIPTLGQRRKKGPPVCRSDSDSERGGTRREGRGDETD